MKSQSNFYPFQNSKLSMTQSTSFLIEPSLIRNDYQNLDDSESDSSILETNLEDELDSTRYKL